MRLAFRLSLALAAVLAAFLTVAGFSPSAVAAGSGSQVDASLRTTAQDQIAVGGAHTCAIAAGDVRCWGANQYGQLGYGHVNDYGNDENEAVASLPPVSIGGKALAITAGIFHTCALRADGRVFCWGAGAQGRLGYGNIHNIGDDEKPGMKPGADDFDSSPEDYVDAGAGQLVTRIVAAKGHTCARMDDGGVRCWGEGSLGRLGRGGTSSLGDNEEPGSQSPIQLGSGRYGTVVAAGDEHSCTVLDDGTVRCWGSGAHGRLGYGTTTTIGDNELPTTVGVVNFGGGIKVFAMSAGADHTCALLANATIKCWGVAADGRLGYGDQSNVGDNETPASRLPVNLL